MHIASCDNGAPHCCIITDRCCHISHIYLAASRNELHNLLDAFLLQFDFAIVAFVSILLIFLHVYLWLASRLPPRVPAGIYGKLLAIIYCCLWMPTCDSILVVKTAKVKNGTCK